MKVLITGGAGFIARHVKNELERQGHVWESFDIASGPHQDVRSYHDVWEAVHQAEGVIHLAAVLGTSETIHHPHRTAEVNILGAINVMEACATLEVPMVLTGTGNHWLTSGATGPYPITKKCGTEMAAMYRAYRGLKINIVRPMNAYGPWQKVGPPFGPSSVQKIMPTFITSALAGAPIPVRDGAQVSDCVHVEDVARVLVAALDYANAGWLVSTVEVGPVVSHTVEETARLVQREVHEQTGVMAPLAHESMWDGEVRGVTRANAETCYTVGVDPNSFKSLEDGIRETVRHYRAMEGLSWVRPGVRCGA